MHKILPPVCLAMAMIALICGIALFSSGGPEPGHQLRKAQINGPEDLRIKLEKDLESRQFRHTAFTIASFISAGLFATGAFVSMNPGRN